MLMNPPAQVDQPAPAIHDRIVMICEYTTWEKPPATWPCIFGSRSLTGTGYQLEEFAHTSEHILPCLQSANHENKQNGWQHLIPCQKGLSSRHHVLHIAESGEDLLSIHILHLQSATKDFELCMRRRP